MEHVGGNLYIEIKQQLHFVEIHFWDDIVVQTIKYVIYCIFELKGTHKMFRQISVFFAY